MFLQSQDLLLECNLVLPILFCSLLLSYLDLPYSKGPIWFQSYCVPLVSLLIFILDCCEVIQFFMHSIHPINILQSLIYLLWFNGWYKWEMLIKWNQSWSFLYTSRNISNNSVQWMIPCNIDWLEYWNLIACTCLIIGLRWCTSHLILFIFHESHLY